MPVSIRSVGWTQRAIGLSLRARLRLCPLLNYPGFHPAANRRYILRWESCWLCEPAKSSWGRFPGWQNSRRSKPRYADRSHFRFTTGAKVDSGNCVCPDTEPPNKSVCVGVRPRGTGRADAATERLWEVSVTRSTENMFSTMGWL